MADFTKELEQETQKKKKEKQKRLRINYDDAVEEYRQDNPPIEIVFEGEVYEAPASVTTEIFMFLIENMDDNMDLTDQQALKLLPMVFGKEIADKMRSSKAPFHLLPEKVLLPIMRHWGFGGEGPVEEKND